MTRPTHPDNGFIVNDDGSADIFISNKEKEEREQRRDELLAVMENATAFSADGSPDSAGFSEDFVSSSEEKLDQEGRDALKPRDASSDISIGEVIKQIAVGAPLDAVKETGELVTDLGDRLRGATVSDIFNTLSGVAQGLDPAATSEGSLETQLPEDALGEFGSATVQEVLDGIHPTLGGKLNFAIPEIEKKGGGGVQFARGLAAFFTGFTALKAMGIARNSFTAATASDVLTTDAEQNLANLFNQMSPELANPLSEFLEAKIDDTELELRFKQAGLGILVGFPIEAGRQLVGIARHMRDAGVKSSDLLNPQQALDKLAAHNQAIAKKSRGEFVDDIGDGVPQAVNPKTAVSIRGFTFDIDGIDKFIHSVNSDRLIRQSLAEADELISSRQVGNTGMPVRYTKEAIAEARIRMKKDPLGETKRILELNPQQGITDVDPIIMEIVYGAHHLQAKAFAEELAKQGAYDSGGFLQAHILSLHMAQQRRRLSATASRTLGVRRGLKDFELDQAVAIGESVEDIGTLPPGTSERDLINNYIILSKEQLAKSHTQAAAPGMKDALQRLYYFNLLSGVDTQVGNVMGGMLNLTFQTAARQMAGKARGTLKFFGSRADGVDEDEGANLMFGLMSGFRRQLPILARNLIKTARGQDIEIDPNTKLEGMGQKPAFFSAKTFNEKFPTKDGSERSDLFGAVVNQIGAPLEAPGRFLMSFDQLIRGAAFDAANHAASLRKAKADGLVGNALEKRVQFYLDHPTPAVLVEATKFANTTVFLDELGPISGRLAQGLDESYWARFLVPFLKVLVNIAKFPVRHGPLGPLTPHQFRALKKGGVDRDIAIGQMMAGTGFIMAGLAFAHGEGIQGTFGSNASIAAAKRRQNRTPCSFRVTQNDGTVRDIGFNNLAPVGQYFCAAADLHRIIGQANSGERMELAREMMDSTRKILLNATFAQNIIQISNALEARNFEVLENLVSALIPAGNIVADVQRNGLPFTDGGDRRLKDTKTVGRKAVKQAPGKPGIHEPFYAGLYQMMNRIQSRLPTKIQKMAGFSQVLIDRHNLWGQPIDLEGGLGPDNMSPIYTSSEVTSPIDQLIIDNQVELTMPPDNYKGVLLEPDERKDWIIKAGKPALKFLENMYEDGAFENMSSGPKGGIAKVISGIVGSFREQAMTEMLEDPKHSDLLGFLMEHEFNKALEKNPMKVN